MSCYSCFWQESLRRWKRDRRRLLPRSRHNFAVMLRFVFLTLFSSLSFVSRCRLESHLNISKTTAIEKIVILIWIYGGRFLFELWGWIACRLFRLFQRTQRHVCPTWFSRYIQRYYTRVLWFSRHNWRYIRFGKQLTRIGIQEDVHVKMTANAFWCYLRWL